MSPIFYEWSLIKVNKSQKQIMASWILPKHESLGNFQYLKLPQRSFFGTENCPSVRFLEESRTTYFFPDLLTFRCFQLTILYSGSMSEIPSFFFPCLALLWTLAPFHVVPAETRSTQVLFQNSTPLTVMKHYHACESFQDLKFRFGIFLHLLPKESTDF